MSVDTLSICLKALGYVALLQSAGVALFIAVFEPSLEGSAAAIRRFGIGSTFVSIFALLLFHVLEAARMTGDYSGLWDPALQARVLASPQGAATALKVLGTFLIAVGLTRTSRDFALLSTMGAAMATTAFLLVGHSVTHHPRWALVPLLDLHLLVVAFWIGSIVPLGMIVRREVPLVARALVERFSTVAAVSVAMMAVAGLAMAWILTGGHFSLSDPYCLSLTGKLALLSAALVLAALNRWRFGPDLIPGSVPAVRVFSRSLAIEYVLLIATVTLTATMTALYSPAH